MVWTPIAFTPTILPSPVSKGVRGIWYTTEKCAYCNAHMAGPVLFNDSAWVTVVKASPTAVTQPIDSNATGLTPPPDSVARRGFRSPALFGIREVAPGAAMPNGSGSGGQTGRVALMNMWPQFHVGGGGKWIMNNQTLWRGSGGASYGLKLRPN